MSVRKAERIAVSACAGGSVHVEMLDGADRPFGDGALAPATARAMAAELLKHAAIAEALDPGGLGACPVAGHA